MKRLLIILLCGIGLVSCSDFLDKQLEGSFNSDIFFSNADQVGLAVTGVYNSSTEMINMWKFGDVPSDDSNKGGNDGDQTEILALEEWTADAENGVILEMWQALYQIAASANNVITNIASTDMDADLKAQYVGECKYHRALAYFTLVNIYGSVPLKLLPQETSAAIHVPLSSVSDIYASIESDLSDACASLPDSYSSSEFGRVTKGAALGLLAKAQLYQAKYTEVLSTIALIEELSIYDLEPEYGDLFKLSGANSAEILFAFQFLSEATPSLGNSLNQYFAPLCENGYYFNAPTQDYVDCFDELQVDGQEDPRLDASIGIDGREWLNDDYFEASWSPSTGYLVKKHNQPLSEVAVGIKGDGGLHYIYMRYADILLMKAEALVEGGSTDALTPLNKVRQRANLEDLTLTDISQIRDAVRVERRREFGFEFHRFFDIMRWGEEYTKATLGSDFPWVSPRFYFPIPQSEYDSNQALQ